MTLPRESDFATDGDPRDPHDRDRSGYSLANNRELVFGCLEAAGAKSVVEIGSEYGAFTREQLSSKLDMPVNLLRASLRRSLLEVEQCLGP